MLYSEILLQGEAAIRPALENLFELAFNKQIHPQDLFLVLNVGYHDRALDNNNLGLSKYVVGKPGIPGLTYSAAYEFIHRYAIKHTFSKVAYEAYKTEPHTPDERDEITLRETLTIQFELLHYMKFWESDLVLRELYQLTRLANKDCYNWDFTIDNKSRQEIIRRKVIKRIAPHNNDIATVIDQAYKPQIRNAAAHSLYYFIGSSLQFTNAEPEKGHDITHLSLDDWCPYISKTLVLFNELIRIKRVYELKYEEKAAQNGNLLEFLLPKNHPQPRRTITFFPELNRWGNVQIVPGQ